MARGTRWLTESEGKAWRAFIFATQMVDVTLDRQLQRDAGMPHTYFGILAALSDAPQRTMRMSDLARAVRFSQSRLTHAVASMERSGWVQRRECPDDKRSQLVSLTRGGVAKMQAIAPGHVAEVRATVFDKLTDTQVEQLRTICETLLADPPT